MRFASASVAGGASSTLKATSGGRAATSVAPAVGCGRGRAVVGRQPVERARPPQRGSRAPARERAIEIDRQAEVGAEAMAEQQRLGARRPALGVGAVHDRGDVERPHARVHARVRAQVDPLDRDPRALRERAVQLARLAREREDGAVVIGVGVDVEHARAAGCERRADGLEDARGRGPRRRWGPPAAAAQPTAAVATIRHGVAGSAPSASVQRSVNAVSRSFEPSSTAAVSRSSR